MIDEDVIAAIDGVLSEGIATSLRYLRSIHGSRKSLKVKELRDIVFKEDLFEKFKDGLTPKVIFNAVKEKIHANA
ncbi:ubiquitin carboxyl-terminal hydrolase family protein, partial [Trifolium medium]|nr:ubiquitin carboxyl-terminal hydrolase family protein [Trifolium medium]